MQKLDLQLPFLILLSSGNCSYSSGWLESCLDICTVTARFTCLGTTQVVREVVLCSARYIYRMFDKQTYTLVVSTRVCDCFQYVSFFNSVLADLGFVISSSFFLESWFLLCNYYSVSFYSIRYVIKYLARFHQSKGQRSVVNDLWRVFAPARC
jgi:hypothetical protein